MVHEGSGSVPVGEPRKRFHRKRQNRIEGQATGITWTGLAGVSRGGGARADRIEHYAVLPPDLAADLRFGHCARGESRNAAAEAGVSSSGRCAGATAAGGGKLRGRVRGGGRGGVGERRSGGPPREGGRAGRRGLWGVDPLKRGWAAPVNG